MKLFNVFLILVLVAGCCGDKVSLLQYDEVVASLEAHKEEIRKRDIVIEGFKVESAVLEKKYSQCLAKLPKNKKPGFLRRKLKPLGRIFKKKDKK